VYAHIKKYTVSSEGIQGVQGEKHEDPVWGAYRVLYRMSQNMCPALKATLLHRGRSTKLPREKGHLTSMPSDMRGCKGAREGVKQCRSPDPAGVIDQGFSRETPVKEQYTGRHKCKGNKFPCQETQTSVCLCNLSQPKTVKSIDPI